MQMLVTREVRDEGSSASKGLQGVLIEHPRESHTPPQHPLNTLNLIGELTSQSGVRYCLRWAVEPLGLNVSQDPP